MPSPALILEDSLFSARQSLQPPPPTGWTTNLGAKDKTAALLWHGLAPSTRSTYASAWNNYETFCKLNGHSSDHTFPASFEPLSDWIADTLEKAKPETVSLYITAIKSRHIDFGYDTKVFDDPRIKRMLQGALCLFETTPIRDRGEITGPLLLKMVKALNPNLHDDANLIAAFTVAFAAFLRPGDFTWSSWDSSSHKIRLSRGSVSFTHDGAILHLPRSKTDKFGKGASITLASAPDECCPVRALRRIFDRYPLPVDRPLFNKQLGAFNRTWLESAIRRTILHAGSNPTIFSGHSFRRGAANSAVSAGIPKDEIKELGRWKSNAVDRYLTESSSQKLRFATNAKLHKHLAPSPQ